MAEKVAGGARRARDRPWRRRGDLRAEHAVLPGRLPRDPARQRGRHQRELAVHADGARPPAPRLRREAALHRLAVPGAGAGRGRGGRACPPRRSSCSTVPRGTPRCAICSATSAEPPALEVGPGDTAVLPYSSGTTGRAKGVILTHRNLVANLCQIKPLFEIDDGTKLIAVLPFFHIYGMTVLMNNGLANRATVVTMPKFDLPAFLRAISEYKIGYVYIAPPVAVALAKHPIVDEYDLSCIEVVFSGAAPLDAELGNAVAKRLGLPGAAGLRHDRDEPGQPRHSR